MNLEANDDMKIGHVRADVMDNKIMVWHKELYLDVADQVLVMNFVARKVWQEKKEARDCFERIHKAYNALGSEESLKDLIGEDSFSDYFSNFMQGEDGISFQLLMRKFYESTHAEERLSMTGSEMYRLSSGVDKLGHCTEEDNIVYAILDDVFDMLDTNQRISNPGNYHNGLYFDFINTLFGRVRSIDTTYGYGHKNLYMCLYHLDLVYENFIDAYSVEEGDCLSPERNAELLRDSATWLRKTTSIYKCTFYRPEQVALIMPDERGTSVSRGRKKFTISLREDQLGRLNIESNPESIDLYLEKVSGILKEWLLRYVIKNYDEMNYKAGQMQSEYDSYVEVAKNNRRSKIVKRFDGVSTLFYALLAYDYCIGAKKNFMKWKTKKEVVENVQRNHSRLSAEEFPMEGVLKTLRLFNKQAKSDYYYLQDQILKGNKRYVGEFFSYPLFF